MRLLKNILLALVCIAVLAVGGAFLLPGEANVSRSVVINAPPDKVFPLVNDLKQFHKWSPWSKIDPQMQTSFEGPEAGPGQKMTWSSDHQSVGKGAQTITESKPNEHVTTALDFGDMGQAKAAFDLTPEGQGTKVTWSFNSDLGMNPLSRWMGLMFDSWIGEPYEKGLADLKKMVETEAAPAE